jgi:hypothetical protein
LNSNLTKSMTYHNQTKELITWFLTSTHDVSFLCSMVWLVCSADAI